MDADKIAQHQLRSSNILGFWDVRSIVNTDEDDVLHRCFPSCTVRITDAPKHLKLIEEGLTEVLNGFAGDKKRRLSSLENR